MALTQAQQARFEEDGFLIVEGMLDPADCERAAARCEKVFAGEYDTGVVPDGLNFGEGQAAAPHNRQMDNCWRSDYTLASLVLRQEIGECLAQLAGFSGARLLQDILIWKVPGSLSVRMHQDSDYTDFVTPRELYSCAIALTDTDPSVGTIEYVRGSHRWGLTVTGDDTFYGKLDYRGVMLAAAAEVGVAPEIVPIQAPIGSAVFHHALTWHGSGPNTDPSRDRKNLVVQCAAAETRFDGDSSENFIGQQFRRYKHFDSDEMDESFFPILWSESGYRTPWLDEYAGRARAR